MPLPTAPHESGAAGAPSAGQQETPPPRNIPPSAKTINSAVYAATDALASLALANAHAASRTYVVLGMLVFVYPYSGA